MSVDRAKLKWNGWGWADHSYSLEGRNQLFPYIRQIMGVETLPSTPSMKLEEIALPPSRLTSAQLTTLYNSLGESQVKSDRFERVLHSVGRSTHDLLRLRGAQLKQFVDAVVYPTSDAQLQALLALARAERWALLPFGGGSSVVGGLEALGAAGQSAILSVDLSQMNKLLALDPESLTATFQAGVYGPELERVLGERGFSLGHFPQSFEFSTLGGWVAARSSGQQSNAYGALADRVVALKVVTPVGDVQNLAVPNSAVGPSLREILVGSEGIFGFISQVTVRIHPKPERRKYSGVLFKNFEDGKNFIRSAVHAGLPAAMLRLSDENETESFSKLRVRQQAPGVIEALLKKAMLLRGYGPRPALMMLGFEGKDADPLNAIWARRLAAQHGGMWLGSKPGEHWYAGRFESPYLRDVLFDCGVVVDTLETVTEWSNISVLKRAVTEAIEAAYRQSGSKGVVLCHISHSYADGASLYFTLVWGEHIADPLAQWKQIKDAASQAIASHGGSISHHHGVGVDHARWAQKEWGEVGMRALRALKQAFDPDNTMNPGKLV